MNRSIFIDRDLSQFLFSKFAKSRISLPSNRGNLFKIDIGDVFINVNLIFFRIDQRPRRRKIFLKFLDRDKSKVKSPIMWPFFQIKLIFEIQQQFFIHIFRAKFWRKLIYKIRKVFGLVIHYSPKETNSITQVHLKNMFPAQKSFRSEFRFSDCQKLEKMCFVKF